jgi:hypothetical protein
MTDIATLLAGIAIGVLSIAVKLLWADNRELKAAIKTHDLGIGQANNAISTLERDYFAVDRDLDELTRRAQIKRYGRKDKTT